MSAALSVEDLFGPPPAALSPFAASARVYLAGGWWPLPLPPVSKKPPPSGFTGSRSARAPTAGEIDRWAGLGYYLTGGQALTVGNIAVRLPPDVVGIDVDDGYGADGAIKVGAVTLAELEERFGSLPPTCSSTARGWGPSRIRFYRVPVGWRLRSILGDSVETIQHHHRYAVVWPSQHPDAGQYHWFDDAGEQLDGPPDPADLPDLPWAWLDELRSTGESGCRAVPATPAAIAGFYAEACGNAKPAALQGVLGPRALGASGSRHDRLVAGACMVAREAAAGWYPMAAAELVLRDWWATVMDDPRRLAGSEVDDAIAWGIAQVDPASEQMARKLDEAGRVRTATAPTKRDGEPDGLAAHGHLPATFWERPALQHIRTAARARLAGPDAVLAVALARVAFLTPASIDLPGSIGTAASLNVITSLVGPPGVGKSIAARVAAEVLPSGDRVDLRDDVPLGSGEGLIDSYFEMVQDPNHTGKGVRMIKTQTVTSVLATLDEGAALAELGARKGSTLLPTLRSAWTGDTLGAANATVERHRRLPAGAYRMAIIMGFQPSTAVTVLDDTATGTAARFLWASATDPDAPDVVPPWPGPLEWKPPDRSSYAGQAFRRSLTIDAAPAAELVDRRRSRLRGDTVVEEIDAHRDLARLKVAGLLALLDERMHITVDDWALAGLYVRTSDAVRSVIIEHARAAGRQKHEGVTALHVAREGAVADDQVLRATERMARAIGRHVHKAGTATRRTATHACAGRDKQLATLDDALDQATKRGWIVVDGDDIKPGESRPT